MSSQIGLYGDPEWVRPRKKSAGRRTRPSRLTEPQPTPVHDDFEETLPDLPPEGPTLSVEDAGTILVTGELAASGSHSLKFTDAATQKFSFDPHLWYSPRFVGGRLGGSFDVRMEPGAIGHFEWRDYSDGDLPHWPVDSDRGRR